MTKSAKGSSFERQICRELSMWWTDNERDDIFWRTSASGARATQRRKVGKKTFGQEGDIQATDPIGQKLIDVCTIEVKRGYSGSTFADLADKPKDAAEQCYEKFLNQAIGQYKNSGSISWLLITKRDRRNALVFIPESLSFSLDKVGSNLIETFPRCKLYFYCKTESILESIIPICVFDYKRFFDVVKPIDIKRIRGE